MKKIKKKYITLEEVLTLKGTDTKIYVDGFNDWYLCWFRGDLCRYKNNKLNIVGVCAFDNDKYYILEPEEFKVDKTGLYKTRDGKLAFVGFIDLIATVRGYIEGKQHETEWFKDGHCYGDCNDYDLVEYVGE